MDVEKFQDVEQFQDDVREGRIDADRLVDLVVTSLRELQAAKRRIEELEKKLGGSPTVKIDEPFSLRAEEQRQEKRGKKPKKKPKPLPRSRRSSIRKRSRGSWSATTRQCMRTSHSRRSAMAHLLRKAIQLTLLPA